MLMVLVLEAFRVQHVDKVVFFFQNLLFVRQGLCGIRTQKTLVELHFDRNRELSQVMRQP
jgi:hypothetical protein